MDIYRFFHPQYNPRLLNVPVRLQELLELLQVASELRKAVERVRQRASKQQEKSLLPSQFNNLISALEYVELALESLCDSHEGDSLEELLTLVREREGLVGWDNWTQVVRELVAQGPDLDGNIAELEENEENSEPDLSQKPRKVA